MSQAEKLVGASGVVRIDALEIVIAPLSQAEEMRLDRELRAAAAAALGDHYTRNKALLDAMKDDPAARAEAVREIVRLNDTRAGVSGLALHDFRCSAEGLAIELFARGKAMTPGLDKKALAAVLTEVNADQIAAALFSLLEGDDKKSG